MLRDLFSLFPAYAGVILSFAVMPSTRMSFPRIRGGDPVMQKDEKTFIGFSPHTRG